MQVYDDNLDEENSDEYVEEVDDEESDGEDDDDDEDAPAAEATPAAEGMFRKEFLLTLASKTDITNANKNTKE